jgi:hypothetical protein
VNRILSAIVVSATFAFAPLLSNAAGTPDATLDISGSRGAVGVGFVKASGTLHFLGQNYPVQVRGFTIGEVGGGTITATGDVYNLGKLSDLDGSYDVATAGAALGGGSGGASMQNQHGVVIKLRGTMQGASVNLSIGRLALKVAGKPSLDMAGPALGCAGGMDATGNDCM